MRRRDHHVGLADALELTLIYLDKEPARYERAALRWHARLCAEARLTLEEGAPALALLAALRVRNANNAASAVASLLGRNRMLLPASELLIRWRQRAAEKVDRLREPERSRHSPRKG